MGAGLNAFGLLFGGPGGALYRRLFVLFAMSAWLACGADGAGTLSVAVVFPDVREPYRGVFLQIVHGMEKELGQPVPQYLLSDQQDSTTSLIARMKADHVDVVVTLGRAGFVAAKPISEALPVVFGAVLLSPGQDSQGLSGISLVPDPEVVFARLKELVPEAREVTVIYDSNQRTTEIAQAKDAARTQGVTLHALPVADLRQSAATYQDVLRDFKGSSSTIWLRQDNAVMDEQALLPEVLRKSWDERFVVFSSSLDHVKKGALFSLYPDNFSLGRSLAVMARSRAPGLSQPNATIEPLRDVLIAVNLRTAEHLGLSFDSDTRRKFGLTFPARR